MVSKHESHVTNSPESLQSWHCCRLSYRITVASKKFALESFIKAIGDSLDESHGWKTIIRLARNPKLVDYHLDIYWRSHPENESQLQLQVDYHAMTPASDERHPEPYAEEFMGWLGTFFEDESVTTHLHGEFEYPIEGWQTKLMTLPIKIPYGGKEAIIDGLTIRLPSKPEGVHDVWMQRGTKTLDLQLYADRPLVFKTFSPYHDLMAFAAVLKTLIEERQL